MKILNKKQLKEVESITIKNQNINMIDLMERAATAIFDWLQNEFESKNTRFTIFCGNGNNGGDGLVVSRLLKQNGYIPKAFLLKSDKYSDNNLINQKKLAEIGVEINYFDKHSVFDFQTGTVIIDSIFGYGLNRPTGDDLKHTIEQMNQSGCQIISIDLPSGMFCDQLNQKEDTVVQSAVCLTFDSPKLSILLPENNGNPKRFEILDIGFDKDALDQQTTGFYFIDKKSAALYKKTRNRFGYKYNYGNVLIIGGSYGKIGSVCLSSKAALRCGTGLITAYVPKCGLEILQTSFPEAMVMTDFSDDKIIGFPDTKRFDTIAIGPGMGTDNLTLYGIEQFLSEADLINKKLVIDADGINILSKNRYLLKVLPENTILTPHNRELERLIGGWSDSNEKFSKIREICNEHKIYLVSKGAFSQIFCPDGEVHINSTANPGMATAGSGDVLTGMIAGLLGRGYNPKEAAILGVYLHGLSGDLATRKTGEECLIASDLIDFIPKAFLETFGK